jgi:hypothetical protein
MNETITEVSFPRCGLPAGDASASRHSISAEQLLEVWEQGQDQVHVEKALMILTVAHPNVSRETLAKLTIGQRDASLIALRESLFGVQLTSLTDCPACGDGLELSFNVLDIRTSSAAQPIATLTLNQSGYELELRLPNSLDLLALTDCSSTAEMRSKLVERCVRPVGCEGQSESVELLKEMPSEIVELAIKQIGDADPQADIEINLLCPSCRHGWQTYFDIVTYLWTELHAWALRMLREVHLLASNYGWRESDILRMSSWRRHRYLELLIG